MLSRIEETIRQLPAFREDPRMWECCAYREHIDPEFGRCDGNGLDRYRFLIALQYHYCPDDEDLVRYLFDQEVIACKNHEHQGLGDPLKLASYLLSRWKRQADFWRFAKAKFANYDTYEGFDGAFLLVIGRDESLATFAASDHTLKEDVRKLLFNNQGECQYSPERLDSWQQALTVEFPKQPERERAWVWIERAISFQLYEEGRKLVDQYEASSNDTSSNNLLFWRKQLHDWKKAIKIQEDQLKLAENDWDRASGLCDLAELLLEDHRADKAWTTLRSVEDNLQRIRSWTDVGLGRSVVEVAFRIVKQATKETAKEAFAWGCRLEAQLKQPSSLQLLTLATAAAEIVGDKQQREKFGAAATAEKAWIDKVLNR